jgi:hypothetical protein
VISLALVAALAFRRRRAFGTRSESR